MNFLEEQFKKSPNNKVRTVITNIFEGDRQYETRCSKCDKTSIREDKFHELELSMDSNDNKSLKASLKSLIKAEKLQGDNKYRCDDCGLVDASRKMNLTRLPIILNIQLLRFVYNPQTGNKAKLTIPYSFPRTLDMSPYLTGERRQMDNMYELTAVLIHLGETANGGHYIAHVYDENTNSWWKFNDSKVEPIETKEIGEREFSIQETADQRKRDVAIALINKVKKKIISQNAYMLIYSRRDRPPIPDPQPPPHLLSIIEANNEAFLNEIKEWKERKESVTGMIEEHREKYKKFLSIAQISRGDN